MAMSNQKKRALILPRLERLLKVAKTDKAREMISLAILDIELENEGA